MQPAISYAAAQGVPPFDWNAFLLKPSYTDDEWQEAQNYANEWVTCACGNQCAVLPRGINGVPMDRVLADLGAMFCDAIWARDISEAYYILQAIEQRATTLLNAL